MAERDETVRIGAVDGSEAVPLATNFIKLIQQEYPKGTNARDLVIIFAAVQLVQSELDRRMEEAGLSITRVAKVSTSQDVASHE